MTLKKDKKSGLIIAFVLFSFSFFLPGYSVEAASGAYGWFSPKVIYVSDTPASVGCNANQASLEIWLVELGTQTQINNGAGEWNVKVRESKSNMNNILEQENFTAGTKTSASGIVCFEPSKNGLQVSIKNSANYHQFNGPTLFPGTTDLDSMKGKHFRGFVELEPKIDSTPSIEAVLPDGEIFSGNPTFTLKTNSISNSYGANQVDTTRIFVINQTNTNDTTVFTDSTNRSIGTHSISTSGSTALDEGVYYWTFHQELNGITTTQKVSFLWTFSQIPSSGAPTPLSFTIDKTPPTSAIDSVSVSSISPVTLIVSNPVGDKYAGLDKTTINVKNQAGDIIYSKTRDYSATNIVNIDTYEERVTDADIVLGGTYRIYAVTVDNLGHSTTTSEKAITISGSYAKPIISGLNIDSSALPYKINATVNTNGSTVTNWGSCWSTNNLTAVTFFTDSSATCSHSGTPKSSDFFQINDSYNSMPVGTTIYYMAYAKNLGGTTTALMSNTISSNATNTLPAVEYVAPSELRSSSLNPGIKIISTGSSTTLQKHGICWFTSSGLRSSFDFTNSTSLNAKIADKTCRAWNVSSPADWAYRNVFSMPSPNTKYYFKAFAQNSAGLWGYAEGEASTTALQYTFSHLTLPPPKYPWFSPRIEYSTSTSNFNEDTETFNEVRVRVAAVDESSEYISTSTRRTVGYTAYMEYDWDGVTNHNENWTGYDDTVTGVATTHYNGEDVQTSLVERSVFNDVPVGRIYVFVKFNSVQPSVSGPVTYNSDHDYVTLTNPNIPLDSIVGDENSSSSVLILDPLLKLWASPTLVRAGQSTTLNWSMNNVGADLNCGIKGPRNTSTFPVSGTGAGSGTYSFTVNHLTNSNLTGNISSGNLNNTQMFELKCINGTEEFSTTTRVNVLGTVEEI